MSETDENVVQIEELIHEVRHIDICDLVNEVESHLDHAMAFHTRSQYLTDCCKICASSSE
jgi:hypothetical protein